MRLSEIAELLIHAEECVALSSTRSPNFFIVGAPKCGTTAMHDYLSQHPDVFMPSAKEHNHFATDLIPQSDPYASREHYLALFRDASHEIRVGETSVFHLYSRVAAQGIHSFEPDARIVVMLRDPLQWIASYHSQMLYNGDENVSDLEAALDAESDRRRGRRVPERLRFVQRLFYSEVMGFSEQLERYFVEFGRGSVHVILHDEFVRDPAGVLRDLLVFLEVDPEFEPQWRVSNPNKEVRSRLVSEFLRRPPAWVAEPVTRIFPEAWRRAARVRLRRLNATEKERTAMGVDLRRQLAVEFRPEVDRLQNLLGRSLSTWCDPS